MTTPGVQIVNRAAPPSRGGAARTGTWHIAGLAERGPTDSPQMLYSLNDFDRFFGGRVAYGVRDFVEAHFRNGGVAVNMIRIVGPDATRATVAFPGAAAALSISVDGVGEGPSTFSASVEIAAGDRFVVGIHEGGLRILTSPAFSVPADAASWSQSSPYVRIRATGVAVPLAAAATPLAGGSDDRLNVTDVHRIAALDRIPISYGPGQVSIPGATTSVAHVGVAAHAVANNRFAILDMANTGVAGDLVTASTTDKTALTSLEATYCFLVEGWHQIPGMTPGTTRTVPPSCIVSALMAARDSLTGNPNDPAAGINGIPRFSLGVARANWTDTERGQLNLAGVNVFREVSKQARLYGYRTLADVSGTEAGWVSASNARLRMAIQSAADEVAEGFVFSQISRQKIAEFHGALSGILLGYYALGALFGGSPEDAFVVDTGTTVNTPEQIAERRLSAIIGTRMSEFAEVVYMEFVKVPVTEELT